MTLLLGLVGVTAAASSAAAVEIDAITGVTVSHPSGTVQQWDSVRVDATWAVPDSAHPGDTFRLALPTTPRVVGFRDAFDLKDPSAAVVGSCTVEVEEIVCVLGEYVSTHTGVHGSLHFLAQVTETSEEDTIVFTTGGGVEIPAGVPGGGVGVRENPAPATPRKSGQLDLARSTIAWQVLIPGEYLTDEDGEPVVLTDTRDPRLELDPASFSIAYFAAEDWNGGSFAAAATPLTSDQFTLEHGPGAHQLTFSVPDARGAGFVYAISYETALPDDVRPGDRFENTVAGTSVGDVTALAHYVRAGGNAFGEGVRSILLLKQVDGDGAGTAVGPFEFELACVDDEGSPLPGFPQSAEVSAGGTISFAAVPVGATCELAETHDGGADRVAFAPAGRIEVTADSPEVIQVVATNTFDAHVGRIAVTKLVEGDAADAVPSATEYTVAYTYDTGAGEVSGEVVVSDGTTSDLANLPVGAVVTLDEVEPATVEGVVWKEPVFSGHGVEVLADGAARVVVGDGTTVQVTLTNHADVPTVPVEPAEPAEPGPAEPGSSLATTGAGVAAAVAVAAALLALGLAAVLLSRRARAS
jgi:hypothetical protein